MSTFKVEVVPITISEHPNADKLLLAKVRDWQVCVNKEEFRDQKFGVYLPLDSVADENHPLLGFLKGERVRTIKLRKAISQGLLIPINKVEEYLKNKGVSIELKEGVDLKDALEIKKYEAKIPFYSKLACPDFMAIELPEQMCRYTEIENIKNFPDVIKEGEEVEITEKVHGTSYRASLINGKFYLGSRNRGLRTENFVNTNGELIEIKETAWHLATKNQQIEDKLRILSNLYNGIDVILYGEIIGLGIQDIHYSHDIPTLYAYDIVLINPEHRYVDPDIFTELCNKLELKRVPILKSGPFSLSDLELKNGNTTVNNATHIREGIVIKPKVSRVEYTIGRVVLKALGEEYLMRKNGTDY